MSTPPTSPPPSTRPPSRWFAGNTLLIALLVLFGPLGVLLLWLLRPRWDPFLKGVLTVYGVIWLYTVAALIGGPNVPLAVTAALGGTPAAYLTPSADYVLGEVTPSTLVAAAATEAPAAVTLPPTSPPPTVAPSATAVPVAMPTQVVAPTSTAAPTTPPEVIQEGHWLATQEALGIERETATASAAYEATPSPLPYTPTEAPSPVAESYPTSTPSSDPYPTATASATPTAAANVLLAENFASNERNWPNDFEGVGSFVDGGYRLFARQPGQPAIVRVPLEQWQADVEVSARFTLLGDQPSAVYGLILRDQELSPEYEGDQIGQYYLFVVNSRGQVGIRRRDGEYWTEILPWTGVEGVNSGANASNDLTARAVGSQLTFSINGYVVAQRTDEALTEGSVALYAAGERNEVIVSRLLVQTPVP